MAQQQPKHLRTLTKFAIFFGARSSLGARKITRQIFRVIGRRKEKEKERKKRKKGEREGGKEKRKRRGGDYKAIVSVVKDYSVYKHISIKLRVGNRLSNEGVPLCYGGGLVK